MLVKASKKNKRSATPKRKYKEIITRARDLINELLKEGCSVFEARIIFMEASALLTLNQTVDTIEMVRKINADIDKIEKVVKG